MRVLVTGADGFVGRHLCRLLEENGDVVVPLTGAAGPSGEPPFDVRDRQGVAEAVSRARPDAIVHLAAVSSVVDSQHDPVATFEINTLGTVNLCQAARETAPNATLLLISSGEVYGPVPAGRAATEQWPVAPANPYATSKVAAELVALQFGRSYAMRVLIARPFTHIGRGQSPHFAISSFAKQIVALRGTPSRGALQVGNLEAVRDFSHVRDVVAAYRLLIDRGAAGETYNVSSGHARTVRSVLDELVALAGVDVEIRVDPARFRPADTPNLVGDSTKLRALGWVPRHGVRDALTDLLSEYDSRRIAL